MISTLINWLLTSPSATTTPLYLALNTFGIRTALGLASGEQVTLYNSSVNGVATRNYVRLFDASTPGLVATFLGGGNARITTEQQLLDFEINTVASSAYLAGSRADLISLAVRTQISKLLQNVPNSVLVLSDLGGTSSEYHINNLIVTPHPRGPQNYGPGLGSTQDWTAKRYVRVQVWVTTLMKVS